MTTTAEYSSDGLTWLGRAIRILVAVGFTALLLVFLVVTRWVEPRKELLTIRSAQGIDPVAMPTPPPPPPQKESLMPPPPPPAITMELPKLDLSINEAAPAIKAMMAERPLDLLMKPADFAHSAPQTKARSLFAAPDLDDQPRLLNRPRVNFPSSLKRRGVYEGRVVLEVLINLSGVVSVRRVVSNSHPDLIPMARTFAAKARFTPPKKDGRAVSALFKWPLILRP